MSVKIKSKLSTYRKQKVNCKQVTSTIIALSCFCGALCFGNGRMTVILGDFRLTQLSTKASPLDLESCSRSRGLKVSLGAGLQLCSATVLRVLASLVFMNSLRSTTRTLPGLSMQLSTKR